MVKKQKGKAKIDEKPSTTSNNGPSRPLASEGGFQTEPEMPAWGATNAGATWGTNADSGWGANNHTQSGGDTGGDWDGMNHDTHEDPITWGEHPSSLLQPPPNHPHSILPTIPEQSSSGHYTQNRTELSDAGSYRGSRSFTRSWSGSQEDMHEGPYNDGPQTLTATVVHSAINSPAIPPQHISLNEAATTVVKDNMQSQKTSSASEAARKLEENKARLSAYTSQGNVASPAGHHESLRAHLHANQATGGHTPMSSASAAAALHESTANRLRSQKSAPAQQPQPQPQPSNPPLPGKTTWTYPKPFLPNARPPAAIPSDPSWIMTGGNHWSNKHRTTKSASVPNWPQSNAGAWNQADPRHHQPMQPSQPQAPQRPQHQKHQSYPVHPMQHQQEQQQQQRPQAPQNQSWQGWGKDARDQGQGGSSESDDDTIGGWGQQGDDWGAAGGWGQQHGHQPKQGKQDQGRGRGRKVEDDWGQNAATGGWDQGGERVQGGSAAGWGQGNDAWGQGGERGQGGSAAGWGQGNDAWGQGGERGQGGSAAGWGQGNDAWGQGNDAWGQGDQGQGNGQTHGQGNGQARGQGRAQGQDQGHGQVKGKLHGQGQQMHAQGQQMHAQGHQMHGQGQVHEQGGWGQGAAGGWDQGGSGQDNGWGSVAGDWGAARPSSPEWGGSGQQSKVTPTAKEAAGTRNAVSDQQRSQILNSFLNQTQPQNQNQNVSNLTTAQHQAAQVHAAQLQARLSAATAAASKGQQKPKVQETKKNVWEAYDDDWGSMNSSDEDYDDNRRVHFSPKASELWGGSPRSVPSKSLAAIHAQQGIATTPLNLSSNVRFVESRGAAFSFVSEAFFGNARFARERIHWLFPENKDERVANMLAWVQKMSFNLGSYGLVKFLETRERGALFVNAVFRMEDHPREPAFDWLTFNQLQGTMDKTLQESVAFYDPARLVTVFIYLPSQTGKSVAIWRRKVNVPDNARLKYQAEITAIVRTLRDAKDYVVMVDEVPKPKPKVAQKPAQLRKAVKPISAKSLTKAHPNGQVQAKTKRKWWKFFLS